MHFPPKDSDVGEAESTLGAIMKAAVRTNFGRGCTQAFCHVTENRNMAFVFLGPWLKIYTKRSLQKRTLRESWGDVLKKKKRKTKLPPRELLADSILIMSSQTQTGAIKQRAYSVRSINILLQQLIEIKIMKNVK